MAHLSHEEKLKYTNFFIEADEEFGNGDGALDMDEFGKLMVFTKGNNCSKDDVAAAFTNTDTDGNLKITLDEFLAKLPDFTFSASTQSIAATIKAKLTELEVNQDGFVTWEDLRNGLAKLHKEADKEMLEGFSQEWSKDKDRKQDFQEFVNMFVGSLVSKSNCDTKHDDVVVGDGEQSTHVKL